MPLYDFKCPSGHVSTQRSPAAERDKERTCPVCGLSAKRIFSPPTAIFCPGWWLSDSSDTLPPPELAHQCVKDRFGDISG